MVIDYEGSDYKTRFWQNANRAYEDAVERIALRRLLPSTGKRIIEFGAGFGRLADLYTGYDEIILLDYSRTMLRQAAEQWGHDPRFRFVAADIYHLPFVSGVISTATMIRVIHHIAAVPAALAEIYRVIAPGGTFVLEYANKRNVKAMARYALRRQEWNPYALQPVEFAKLNFDFHPRWMAGQLHSAGFLTQQQLAVSYLRVSMLKQALPVKWMIYVDAILQRTAALGVWSPSVFTCNKRLAHGEVTDQQDVKGDAIFRSPHTGAALRREGDLLVCDVDGTRWRVDGNFYDLKEAI